MTAPSELISRNADFAAHRFAEDLAINPQGNLTIVGCVDTRVDPAFVLGLEQGEAAVIRNVGGRITPATLKTMAMLRKVGQANPESRPTGDWNLLVLHHTDCGMTDLAAFPVLLAEYFEIAEEQLPGKAVSDPRRSVAVDVEMVTAHLTGPASFVSGLVYDVSTGLVETVVPAAQLRIG